MDERLTANRYYKEHADAVWRSMKMTETPKSITMTLIHPQLPQQYLKSRVPVSKLRLQPLELCHQVPLSYLELGMDNV